MLSKISQIPWGSSSITALYLSLFSGVIVALQYDPANPYYSANALDILVPFGQFWRSLHFYSSQLFFLLSASHLCIIVLNGTHLKFSFVGWVKLISSLAFTLLLLFTGYILRGDATGSSAGIIAENIILSIPFIGKHLNYLLFSIDDMGVIRVYANHMVGLGLIWLFLLWSHIKRYSISWGTNAWMTITVIICCSFVNAPMEPEMLGVFKLDGPWFFLGLQEMLRYIQPFWGGVVFPTSFMIALCLINFGGKIEHTAKIFVCFWLLFYTGLSFAALW